MVDEKVAAAVKEMYETGSIKEDPKNVLTLMELVKQVSGEVDDLKEELDDIDEFVGQMVITDKDFKYWLKIGDGKFDYGEGTVEDPSFTMSANWETMGGLMTGDVDGTSAYMSGDLQIEGNLQDTMAYGEFLGLVMETIQEADK